MNVKIEVIPHDQQRYPTVGDWFFDTTCQGPPGDGCDLVIRVSKLSDWRLEMLVAFHELAEVLICKHRGISQESVDKFDKKFEADRAKGKHGEDDEPGDDPKAPYRKEHFFATNVEALLSAELGVNFQVYEKELSALP
jgi:hypothetical protein